MTIQSKAATKEYRDGHARIFGLTPIERKWLEEEERDAQQRVCAACAVDGQRCECEEAVCHVPKDDSDPLKSLMAGTDKMPVGEE